METVTGNKCQAKLSNKYYDKSKKVCISVQKSMKKVTQEKECNIVTDHQ